MTKLERFIYARDVCGWHADREGNVFNKKGRRIGSINNKGYLTSIFVINKKNYHISLHQFTYWFFTGTIVDCIDHIDMNKLNNSIYNLRIVNKQQNLWNNNAKGYCFNKKANKYQAQIGIDKKILHLGMFDTEDEAREAYLQAKKLYHKI